MDLSESSRCRFVTSVTYDSSIKLQKCHESSESWVFVNFNLMTSDRSQPLIVAIDLPTKRLQTMPFFTRYKAPCCEIFAV